MPFPCYWLEPTPRCTRALRRHTNRTPCPAMPTEYSFHTAMTPIEDGVLLVDERGYIGITDVAPFRADPRWPAACACGYLFGETDPWQVFDDQLYMRADGTETTLREAVPGAMWNAWWMGTWWQGSDAICLVVKTPGGEWCVDGRANNCGLPADSWNPPDHHYCWVRHGDPKAVPCTLTVDKNGKTCVAGGGSILAGTYHGFLQNGALT